MIDRAEADLVSTSDPIFGPDSVTRDTLTGLEWLDIPKSINRSHNQIKQEFGSSGTFAGWRLATKSEMDALVISSGLSFGSSTVSIPQISAVMDFFGPSILLATETVHVGGQADFIIDSAINPGTPAAGGLNLQFNTVSGFVWVGYVFAPLTLSSTDSGHWLVRNATPVPEPTGFALVMITGSILLLRRIRSRRNYH